MIPKVIHFCWLGGGEYPELVKKCLESWHRVLPDYDIMVWDTKRIDINSNLWLKQAYENRKWAFAADYVRLYALYNYGGIYLDSDVEVLRSFNDLLSRREFVGEEAEGDIEAAVIGAEKGLQWIKECLEYYTDRPFVKSDGKFDLRPLPLIVSEIVARHNEIEVLPFQYFSPKIFNVGKVCITPDTYCVHHFDGGWTTKGAVFYTKRIIHKTLFFFLGRRKHNALVHWIRKRKQKS